MPRLALSLVFALLALVSLALKVNADARGGPAAMYPGKEDIVGLLEANGFAVEMAPPNIDPEWVTGTRDGCRLQIANVSPQGWHRAIVEWASKDKTLLYSANGEVQGHQPLLLPMIHHYTNRFKRYVGLDGPAIRVRAILLERGCPQNIISAPELAQLSG